VLQRTGQRWHNFQDRARNVPPLNNGVSAVQDRKFGRTHKYRGVPKEGHRGENRKMVAQQKMGIAVKT
jgi:hypothetical protein